MDIYDIIIIGTGPAGLTAGIYAARSGLKVAVVGKELGGTTGKILSLENWPGFSGTGAELMKKFYEHLKKYEVDFIMKEILDISKKGKLFLIKTKTQEFKSKCLIVATGTKRNKLNIPGEKKFVGKGVSYCVTCDSFFFKNKIVAVIGGSDCAATSALALSEIAKQVYIIYRGKKLRCEEITIKRLEQKKNVEFYYEAIPKEIKGKEEVETLLINQKGKEKEIKLDGMFIEIGASPITEAIGKLGIKLDKENYIVVDANMNTSISGLFAAGDVTNQKLKQVIVASAQGAIAAKSAYDFLQSGK